MTPTTNRTFISLESALRLREANLLVEESHRVRPRYFDGKFLAARDLTRDQAYFLARQSGFARALGSGVVEGPAGACRRGGQRPRGRCRLRLHQRR